MSRTPLTDEQRREILRLHALPDGERPSQREIARLVGTTGATVNRTIQSHAADVGAVEAMAGEMRGQLHALPTASPSEGIREMAGEVPTAHDLRDFLRKAIYRVTLKNLIKIVTAEENKSDFAIQSGAHTVFAKSLEMVERVIAGTPPELNEEEETEFAFVDATSDGADEEAA